MNVSLTNGWEEYWWDRDHPLAVELRAHWSEKAAGLESAYTQSLTELVEHSEGDLHHIVDWGCNSGRRLWEAVTYARSNPGLSAKLQSTTFTGVDIFPAQQLEPYMPQGLLAAGFEYLQTDKDSMRPYPAEGQADGAVVLNVAFRVGLARKLIRRVEESLKVGGHAVFSSNYPGHAPIRHGIATEALQQYALEANLKLRTMEPPANGLYFPGLLKLVGDRSQFEVVDVIRRKGTTRIGPDELPAYTATIMNEAVRTGLPEEHHRGYREVVARLAIQRFMEAEDGVLKDPVHTGLVVVRRNAPLMAA